MSPLERPLVDQKVMLEKFPGKGGWTFARLPHIPHVKKNPFGWFKVRGFIDDFEIKQCHVMPMGKGNTFLAVKASIRKKIKKEEGDWVNVVLYEDNSLLETREEFALCLKDDPRAWKHYQNLSQHEQKRYLDWTYSAKTDETKIERMAQSIDKIARGEPL